MSEGAAFAVNVGSILVVLLVTYLVGGAIERAHYRKIRAREYAYRNFPVVNFEFVAPEWRIESTVLAQGSVVVSVDYFKRFLAGLRALVGGRVKSYEPLLDRARREAMLRMIADARRQGCGAVVNVRLETSCIANQTNSNRQRIAGVEMLAYGTGLKLARGAMEGT
jgi:uncharacterized protein YbjQ (UPF0145 family)